MRRSDARADADAVETGVEKPAWVQKRIDDVAAQAASKRVIDESALHGSWNQPAPGRRLAQAFLGLTTTGAVAGLGLLLAWQTFEGLAVLVAFTVASLMTYTALSVSQPTRVSLDGPRLTVRRGRDVEEIDLTGPLRRAVTVGRPDRPNWLVHLETVDGRITELGPTQVDPELVQAAIARYRGPVVPPQPIGD